MLFADIPDNLKVCQQRYKLILTDDKCDLEKGVLHPNPKKGDKYCAEAHDGHFTFLYDATHNKQLTQYGDKADTDPPDGTRGGWPPLYDGLVMTLSGKQILLLQS